MALRSNAKQYGVSLTGLIFILAIGGMILVLGLKILPTVSEYFAAKKAIAAAKTTGTSPADIRSTFNKQAEVNYIESISGKDLEIVQSGNGFDISFEYQKKIPLVGPVSLVIDYEDSTVPKSLAKKKPID